MLKIVLDGELFTTVEDAHRILKYSLNLPEYYGQNLDALWDSLTGELELPAEIEWTNFEKSKELLGDYAHQILSVFEDVQKEIDGFKIRVTG